MLKQNKGVLIVTSLLMLLPIFAGLLLWNRLPDQIATHFGMDGEADGWSGKGFTVFGLPLFFLLMQWICVFAAAVGGKNSISAQGVWVILCLMPCCSLVVSAVIYGKALGMDVPASMITMLFLGLTFLMLGICLPKCRQNSLIGIRLPWTLADEINWNRTHRLMGPLWMAGGIILMATAVLESFWILLVVLLVLTLVPVVYSYCLWRKAGGR